MPFPLHKVTFGEDYSLPEVPSKYLDFKGFQVPKLIIIIIDWNIWWISALYMESTEIFPFL
jgi:hypothetical protein